MHTMDETKNKNQNAMKRYITVVPAVLVLAAAALLPRHAEAQIQEAKQTVFGMDCAPCAHALQKRLGQLEGVTGVTVNLDEGLATLQFDPANRVKLETIRRAVEASGFSARDATVRVEGTLRQENGDVFLTATTGERYLLRPSEKAASTYARLKEAADGEQVVVTGVIPEGKPSTQDQWELEVLDAHT